MAHFQRNRKFGTAIAALMAVYPGWAFGEDKPPVNATAVKADIKNAAKSNSSKPKPGADAKPAAGAPTEKKSYYVPTRGYRLEPQPDIPPYVRNLGKTYKEFEGIDWLNVGLDSRVRFEYRKDDYRPWTDTTVNPPASQRKNFPNSLWLDRTRVYLGVQNILDPFRFVVEFQDSRAFNSIYQYQGQEINQSELISAYGELFFKDAFGKDDRGNDRPLTLRAGRFHFELLDRRLIAENEFRNTTNNFEGFRVKIGKKDNDWDIDSFLMRPVRALSGLVRSARMGELDLRQRAQHPPLVGICDHPALFPRPQAIRRRHQRLQRSSRPQRNLCARSARLWRARRLRL